MMLPGSEIAKAFYELDRVPWQSISWLHGQGVSVRGLTEPDPPTFAKIAFLTNSIFEFASADEPGQDAILFLERDEAGEPIDIVAWTTKGHRLASWLSATGVLGSAQILQVRLTRPPALSVFRTPFSWLRAERQGVVIIHPARAALALSGVTLAAEDVAHGQFLKDTLGPTIVVPRKGNFP